MIILLKLCVCISIFLSYIYNSYGSIVIAGKCSEGVVICCDSQFSQGGRIVSSREASRLYNLTENIAICYVSGAAKHFCSLCQDLDQLILTDRYKNIPLRHQHSEAIAHYARRLTYNRYPSVHAVLVGINKKAAFYDNDNNNNDMKDNNHIIDNEELDNERIHNKVDKYNIYEILPRGTLIKQDLVIAGTGAESVLGLLESDIKSLSNSQFQAPLSRSREKNQDQNMNEIIDLNEVDSNFRSTTSHASLNSKNFANEEAIQNLKLEDLEKVLRGAVESAIRIDPRSGGTSKLLKFRN